ncbi:hypothetical protein [Streptomyces sp. NPDC003247]|uniref:hypothetical protein n=1 Tax=Streptomyces sp. NPDC003247 TaxID=3364677 RepID=UPI0036C76422
MAWDEWEELKSQTGSGDATHMRLNQYPADSGGGTAGGQGDLVAYQDDLGAVGHEAFVLHGRLHDDVDIAGAGADGKGDGSTTQAASALKSSNFVMGAALATTVEVWTTQVKSVLTACAHISNHLDYSKKLHAQNDTTIAADLSGMSVSRLNEYFK